MIHNNSFENFLFDFLFPKLIFQFNGFVIRTTMTCTAMGAFIISIYLLKVSYIERIRNEKVLRMISGQGTS